LSRFDDRRSCDIAKFCSVPLPWVPVRPSDDQGDAMKLTKHLIDSQPAAASDIYLWDESPRGFGVRVRPSGAKTFVFSYRVGSGRAARKARYTIGRFGSITLDQARKEAQLLTGQVAGGADPAALRIAKREALERQERTVALVADEFIERYARPKNRSWREYERILAHYVKPRLGRYPIHAVGRRDVVRLLE
jgi:Arm domain-containing DNA-binding protein